jgi:hypothetical protein
MIESWAWRCCRSHRRESRSSGSLSRHPLTSPQHPEISIETGTAGTDTVTSQPGKISILMGGHRIFQDRQVLAELAARSDELLVGELQLVVDQPHFALFH